MVFTIQQIDIFSHRIENCLNHADCKQIFRNHLMSVRRPDLLQVLDLWEIATVDFQNNCYRENVYMNIIQEIDSFTLGPLSSNTDCSNSDKLEWIRRECASILNIILPNFIDFLKECYVHGSCKIKWSPFFL